MTTAEKLRKARALIEHGWTRGSLAKTEHGQQVDSLDPRARRFCAVGALDRVGGLDCYRHLASVLPPGVKKVADFNDAQRSKKPVLGLYDRAIARAEQEAAG